MPRFELVEKEELEQIKQMFVTEKEFCIDIAE